MRDWKDKLGGFFKAKAKKRQGKILNELERYQEALPILEQAIHLEPNDGETHHARGVALYELGRHEEALAAFEQAIHLKPDYIPAHISKASLIGETGRPQEALALFEQIITRDPTSAVAYYGKGMALGTLGQPQDALLAFEQAIRLHPYYPQAYCNKGVALQKLGRVEEALHAFEQATQLDPTHSGAINEMGLMLKSSRSPDTPSASSSPEAQPSSPPQTHAQITFPKFVEPAPALWQVGDIILNKYQVVGILGEGGMGIVYKVHDSLMNVMAVKRPKPKLFTRQSDKENFMREAETWVKLNDHLHILRCYFVEQVKGIPCLFAEVADGGSLAQSIRERRFYQEGPERALERILNIAIQFAWGLHAAHEQGLVHQDIKPANVLLTQEGIVKVSDFGLAKARTMLEERQEKVVMGQQSILASVGGMTPAYCSPEQAARRGVTRKTDIWSWAVSVLEMFVGSVTWGVGPLAATALEHAPGEEQAAVQMPEEVRELLRRCLRDKPEGRPATMAEIAKELEDIYTRLLGKPYPREKFTPAEASETQAMRLLDQADSFAALGQYEKALTTYEQVIRLDPKNGAAHASKGNVLFHQGNYEAALAACEQACRSDPTYPGGYYNKAQPLTALGKLPEALVALDQAIRLSPGYAPAHSDRGSTLLALGRVEEALTAFEQSIRLDPTDPIPHRNKGLVLADLGRQQEALVACEQALQLDPAYAGAYMVKGKALANLGRMPEALAALEQAVKLDPKYAHAHGLKGHVLQKLERYNEALAACEEALKLNPMLATAHYDKGQVLMYQKRGAEALLAYEQAIKLAPREANYHYGKAIALSMLDRDQEALAACEQAIRLTPNDSLAYYNKGLVLFMLWRLEEALPSFEQAIRLGPNFTLAYYNQALTLQNLGRLEEALAAYEQAIRLDPNYAGAYRNKAIALRDLGRREEALAAHEQAVRLDPNMASLWKLEAREESFSEKQGGSTEEDILSRTKTVPPEAGFTLVLPQIIYQEMVTHVMNGYPHMACGMLGSQDGRVIKHYPVTNAAQNPKVWASVSESDLARFYSNVDEYDGDAAFYMSEPMGEAYPSQETIKWMQGSGVPYVIFSLKQYPERPSCRLFTVDSAGRVTEGKLELI